MTKKTLALLLLPLLLGVDTARADICLTFGHSTDLFRGNVTGVSAGGFVSLSMIEDSLDRATFGSMKLANGALRIALTKNTNTAVVSYTCQIDPTQLNGPCQIQVLVTDPLSGSRTDDVGFLQVGCTAPAATSPRRAAPAGEAN